VETLFLINIFCLQERDSIKCVNIYSKIERFSVRRWNN